MQNENEKEVRILRHKFDGVFVGIDEFEEEDRRMRSILRPEYVEQLENVYLLARKNFIDFCNHYELLCDERRLVKPSLYRSTDPEYMRTEFFYNIEGAYWRLGVRLNVWQFEQLDRKLGESQADISRAIKFAYLSHEWFHCQDRFECTIKYTSNKNFELVKNFGVMSSTSVNQNLSRQEIIFTSNDLQTIKAHLSDSSHELSDHQLALLKAFKLSSASHLDPSVPIDLLLLNESQHEQSFFYPSPTSFLSKNLLDEALKEFLSIICLPYKDEIKEQVLTKSNALNELSTSRIINYYFTLTQDEQRSFVRACYTSGQVGLKPLVSFFREKYPKILPSDIASLQIFDPSFGQV